MCAVREAVRTAFEPLFKRFSWRFGLRFAGGQKTRLVLTVREVRIAVRNRTANKKRGRKDEAQICTRTNAE
ncbi:hypothetical protein ABH19_11950 [Leptospirillum sp. Group II 'CF-1']|nr:hypothetical protein ABH19_11950 [Leptospirillum sp. Group II 'CF-1']